jgi:hypothetical protein
MMKLRKILDGMMHPGKAINYIIRNNLPRFYSNQYNTVSVSRLISLRLNSKIQSHFYDFDCVDLMNEDWDNLIILDGCRYDIYQSVISEYDDLLYPNTLTDTFSPGSSSPETLTKAFSADTHHDTVYISANPFTSTIPQETFHATHDLVNDDNYWSNQKKTVTPEVMKQAVVDFSDKYPHKRVIAHFMQPHHPFLGESSGEIQFNRGVYGERDKQFNTDPWMNAYLSTQVNHEKLLTAYRENIELALPHVMEVIDTLEGKSIITSDHANLIGDRGYPIPVRGYGHPNDIVSKKLRQVPWHEFPSKNRKKIIEDSPIGLSHDEQPKISNRLTQLGYR